MDLNRMIAQLHGEKERLDEAILALERLAAGKAVPAGRLRWLKDESKQTERQEEAEQSPESK